MGKLREESVARGVTLRTTESGSQAYRITFQYKGVPCRETLKVKINKAGLKYAVNLRAEIENQIERGTFDYTHFFPRSPRAERFGHVANNQTVAEALDAWLVDIKHAHRTSTYNAYRRGVRQLKQSIGGVKLRNLDTRTIKTMVRHWGHDRGLTLKTIRNYLLPLRAILDDALMDGIVNFNPVDKIKVAKLIDRQKIQRNKRTYKVDPFSPDEIEKVLAGVEALYGEAARNFFQFGFCQGLRMSELYGLKWIDIDWTHNRVRIERARVERVLQEETKTVAGEREVDLTKGGYTALIRQKKHSLMQDHGFVFVRPENKGPFIDYEHSSRIWIRVLEKQKIRYRNQNQMRHTFASNKLSGNANIFYMVEQMGHETPEMLMKVYAKWIKAARDGGAMPEAFERQEANTEKSGQENDRTYAVERG